MISRKRKIELKNIVRQFPGFSGGWYLIDYIPRSPDAGSVSLIKYKRGEGSVVDKWNKLAVRLMKALPIHFDYIIRALGSREKQAGKWTPLDGLGSMLAEETGCEYVPDLINKSQTSQAMHRLGRLSRKREARNIYAVNLQIERCKPVNILVLDDIVTTGTTIEQIRWVLREMYPLANIYFFVFGKTVAKFAWKVKLGYIF